MKYYIKIQAIHDCWVADWEGDPGRTRIKENAKKFSKKEAEKVCELLTKNYPQRKFSIE